MSNIEHCDIDTLNGRSNDGVTQCKGRRLNDVTYHRVPIRQ